MEIFLQDSIMVWIPEKKSCISEEILPRHCTVFRPHVFRDTAHFVTDSKSLFRVSNNIFGASTFTETQFQNWHFGTFLPAYYLVIHVWNLVNQGLNFHTPSNARASHSTRIWSSVEMFCVSEGRRGEGGGGTRDVLSITLLCAGRGVGPTVLGQSQKLAGDWQTTQPMTVTPRRHDIMRAFSVPPRPSQLHPADMLFVCQQCTMRLAPFISPYHIKPATQYFER